MKLCLLPPEWSLLMLSVCVEVDGGEVLSDVWSVVGVSVSLSQRPPSCTTQCDELIVLATLPWTLPFFRSSPAQNSGRLAGVCLFGVLAICMQQGDAIFRLDPRKSSDIDRNQIVVCISIEEQRLDRSEVNSF
jgi:hypothetical protein